MPFFTAMRAASVLAICVPLVGQCANAWLPMQGLPGPNAAVYASTMWDPDGAGPITPHLVVAGSFTQPGRRIAAWEPATGTWSPLGTGLGDTPNTCVALPNGELVVGGYFLDAGGTPCNRVARWNGTAWSSLGSGMDGPVYDLAVMPNGDLIAVGSFTQAGGIAASRIARWNGSTWAPLGAGCNQEVWAVTALANGDIVAGGTFTAAGGVAANRIARWNGVAWSALGSGTSHNVYGLQPMPNGDLVVAGYFTSAGGIPANYIARWNGTSWSALGSGLNLTGGSTAVMPNGDLLVGGPFTQAGGLPARGIARWNGSTWSSLGAGLGIVGSASAITVLPNGTVAVGGDYFDPSITGDANLAIWNGAAWSAVPHSAVFLTDGSVMAAVHMPNGDLVVGGQFQVVGSTPAKAIARWNGSTWSVLGTGLGIYGDWVSSLALMPNGDLVAGGRFAVAGTSTVNHIARWNGSSWSSLGGGMNQYGIVNGLAVDPSGDLIAVGGFNTAGGVWCSCIARWNGSLWSPLGSGLTGAPPMQSPVGNAVAMASNGELVVAGGFYAAGGVPANGWAHWNGSQWSAMGNGPMYATSMLILPNGDVLAGTRIAGAQVQRWNGQSWSNVGGGFNGDVITMHLLPDGDVVVGGMFTTAGGVPANRIARWNGGAWSSFGAGVGSGTYDYVATMAMRPNGELFVGGMFPIAGGAVAGNLATLTTTCPPSAAAVGTGCSGTGGANVLTARSLPWLGSSFRSRLAGVGGSALAVEVLGIATTSLPLAQVLPQSASGCMLHTSADVLLAHVPSGGMLDLALPVPNSAALAGATFRQQVVALELDALGSLVGASSSNALQAVLGDF